MMIMGIKSAAPPNAAIRNRIAASCLSAASLARLRGMMVSCGFSLSLASGSSLKSGIILSLANLPLESPCRRNNEGIRDERASTPLLHELP